MWSCPRSLTDCLCDPGKFTYPHFLPGTQGNNVSCPTSHTDEKACVDLFRECGVMKGNKGEAAQSPSASFPGWGLLPFLSSHVPAPGRRGHSYVPTATREEGHLLIHSFLHSFIIYLMTTYFLKNKRYRIKKKVLYLKGYSLVGI